MPAPMTMDKDWDLKTIPDFLGGVDGYKRPDQLADNQAVKLLNIIAKQGAIVADTGYKQFAKEPVYPTTDPDALLQEPTIYGTPQGEYPFVQNDQSVETLLVTTKTLYKYDSGNKRYHLVKGTNSTTVAAIVRHPVLTYAIAAFDLVSAVGFVAGDIFSVATADGDEFTFLVDSVAGNTIFIGGGLAYLLAPNISINIGAVVTRGVKLNGDLDHQVSQVNYPGNDWFVFTNGIDVVKRYDGVDCVNVPGLPSGGDVVCRAVAVYNAALFLLNTTEAGVRHPQRARRSNQGDPATWVGGTAGTDDLLDQPGEIHNGFVLGSYLVLYRDSAITRGQFVGASGLNYYFEDMVTGEGCISTGAVAVTEDFHVVVGNNNIYKYTGGYSLAPIGDPIFHEVFSNKGNMNPQRRNRLATIYVPETEEIWIGYPSLDADSIDVVMRWNVTYQIWYTRRFADQFTNFALHQHLNVFSWDDLVGSWDDQKWTWDTQVQVQEAMVVHMTCATAPTVFEYDYNSRLDNATPITYYLETKDFAAPEVELRFDMIEMMIEGVNVLVEYSTDGGLNWNYMGETREKALINQEQKAKARLFKQFPFQKVRFRWSGTDPSFRLEFVNLLYKRESLW